MLDHHCSGHSENHEGDLFNKLLISNHLEQLIDEPTHVRDMCICTDHPFTYMKSGILSSLDPHS